MFYTIVTLILPLKLTFFTVKDQDQWYFFCKYILLNFNTFQAKNVQISNKSKDISKSFHFFVIRDTWLKYFANCKFSGWKSKQLLKWTNLESRKPYYHETIYVEKLKRTSIKYSCTPTACSFIKLISSLVFLLQIYVCVFFFNWNLFIPFYKKRITSKTSSRDFAIFKGKVIRYTIADTDMAHSSQKSLKESH